MKVFVVDDSTIIRKRLKRMLADELDIETIGETGHAQEAIAAIRRQMPDVVLLDIHLLGGDGIDVLRQVKQAQPPPAVIILTDYPYPEYREKCLAAGADYFFVKSTEFDRVIPALNELIAKARGTAPPKTSSHMPPERDYCSAMEPPIPPMLRS